MCGIAGLLVEESASVSVDCDHVVARMASALSHRGPDDQGTWSDRSAGIALGHRRLSILDLSPAGHQPMVSVSGRYVLAFNGEIYNHLDLRAGLPHQEWRGHSDTESLLASMEGRGLDETLRRSVGMFAFALWDRSCRQLVLARDRLGEKPLYYGWQGSVFLFGSELSALRAHTGFAGEIDRNALVEYMRYSYVPGPNSIYRGISKLAPGTYLTVARGQRDPAVSTYWSAQAVADAGRSAPFKGSDDEARAELDDLLRSAVAGQMISDVPLGAFLSGGIDSSTVVAMMQAQSSHRIKTYTIGFHEQSYNEAHHAQAVAAHLGTDHSELYVSPAECLAVIPRLPAIYDEPFADSSQIPTYLLSALARRSVAVSLSGDGGDELFGGYSRYLRAPQFWRATGKVPLALRKGLRNLMTHVSPATWDRLAVALAMVIPRRWRYRNPGDRLHKLAAMLDAGSPDEVYLRLVSQWENPQQLVIGGTEPVRGAVQFAGASFEERMMLLDLLAYLPGDILAKVDRAAMSVSLETRVPMLDHRVVEFAWRLPFSFKIRNGEGKWLLRRVLDRYVPRELIDRPKTGFGVPIDAWLRGPLREWADDLLGSQRLSADGFLEPSLVRSRWQEHLSGRRNWSYQIWNVLMFQAWLDSLG